MTALTPAHPEIRPTDPVVDDIVRQVVEHVRPLRVILFGSRAAGTARPDSDVDLLVVMPDGTDRRAAMAALGGCVRRSVGLDLIVTTPTLLDRHRDNVGLVYGEILETGMDVYG